MGDNTVMDESPQNSPEYAVGPLPTFQTILEAKQCASGIDR